MRATSTCNTARTRGARGNDRARQVWPSGIALLVGLGVQPSSWAATSDDLPQIGPAPSSAGVRVGLAWLDEMVPPFRVAPRDRGLLDLDAHWWAHSTVRVGLRLDLRHDRFSSGLRRTGPGDLRFHTLVEPEKRGSDGARRPLVADQVRVGLGWQVKLPNAEEDEELGTDETDVSLWGQGRLALGPGELRARAGLGILGHPLQLANQDDVLLTDVTYRLPLGQAWLEGSIGGNWRTPRNPARHQVGLSVERACPLRMGASTDLGLTPAAPRWSVRGWLGWGGPCLKATRD